MRTQETGTRIPSRAAIAVLAAVCAAAVLAQPALPASAQNFQTTPEGVVLAPNRDPDRRVRLQVINDRIIRVTATPGSSLDIPRSLMTVASPAGQGFEVSRRADTVLVSTPQLTAEVSGETGAVRFLDRSGKLILAEKPQREFAPTTVQGRSFHTIRQAFQSPADEAFYGLGQHQNHQMNYKGEDVELAQHNMDIGIPFVVSTRNYGLLWDNNSITRFGDPRPYEPIDAGLKLFDAGGKSGGLTATYSVGGKTVLTRIEPRLNYMYLKDRADWPAELADQKTASVFWEGSIEAPSTGVHKFQLYSSGYAKVFIDDMLVLERWRQNWNPWYHNFHLPLQAGKPRRIRVEWSNDEGYIALLHRDPLPAAQQGELSLWSELGHAIDYTFIAGDNLDQVISGYRHVTGKAPMMPRWAYGFWQSRQRYKTQEELVDVVAEYRRRRIPIDNIVMDWFYWREDDWGSHRFDPDRFPDPKGMIDAVHRMDARLMISVWAKFYPTTENYRELDARGYIYRRNVEKAEKDWVGPGYVSSFYDPYPREAREIFWRQVRDNLNVLGIDAWWLDASEPDIHSNLDIEERKLRMGPTALGPGAAFFNSYPLLHAQGVYEGERRTDPDKRTFILTRSGFAGLQRYGAAVWSGDVVSRWSNLREQISAGVNLSMSGIPNWTHDIGGFSLEKRYEQPNAADLAEWRELNLRWFQFGAFSPLFRSHGEFPYREVWHIAPEGTEVYDSLVWHSRLRYRLLPYIYSLAGDTHHRDGTITRGLVMDFPEDRKVRNIDDEYLFGPSFLVAPVHDYKARERAVYLPAGTRWYDFHTGRPHEGGREIKAAAPLSRMPLYVRSGAIVPLGPDVQHTAEQTDGTLSVWVYAGRDGALELYEDDGLSYSYENGAWSRIPFAYDDATGAVTVGARRGSWPGMPERRRIGVRWISSERAGASDLTAQPDAVIDYDGQPVTVRRPGR